MTRWRCSCPTCPIPCSPTSAFSKSARCWCRWTRGCAHRRSVITSPICGARLLITFETSAEEAVRGATEIDGLRTYVAKAPIDAHLPAGTHHFDELYFAQNTEEIEPTDADDTALIVYTNAKPNGAELTHSQLFDSCTASELFGFRDDDIDGQRDGCVDP